MKKIFLLILCMALLFGCVACGVENAPAESNKEQSQVVTETSRELPKETVSPGVVETTKPERDEILHLTELALQLAQRCEANSEGENMLVSPLSVFCALAMVSNGADDMEAVEDFWNVENLATLNSFISGYTAGLPQGEDYKLHVANSVWYTSHPRFTVNEDFLQTVADYYRGESYKTAFDARTIEDINAWVEQNTDGMVKDILDRLPGSAVMYLVNALAFEAEWQKTYNEHQVREGIFHGADGKEQTVDMMSSEEHRYIEDENATGFIKLYTGGKYAFAALLPREGMTVEAYLTTLTGEGLLEMLANPVHTTVYTKLPAFETEYKADLVGVLGGMGYPVTEPFNGVGTSTSGDVMISRILHKTYITVGPLGTKAGAATVIEMTDGMVEIEGEIKYVTLDRPFVYLLIDTETNLPFFIGTVQNVG